MERGLKHLLSMDKVAGRIELLELRAMGSLAATPQVFCYPASLQEAVAGKESESLVEQVGIYLRELLHGERKSVELTEELVIEIHQARKQVRDAIAAVPTTKPTSPTRTTAIERPVREAILNRCSRVQVCRVMMFSDLIDSDIQKQTATLDDTASRELGLTYAQKILTDEAGSSSGGVLQVIVWGFGRDEKGKDKTLSEAAQNNLAAFWTAYFFTICEHQAPGSGVSISLEAPQRLPDRCS